MTAFTGTLTDRITPYDGSGLAIKFDGSQNYISLGVLGALGSNLNSGIYCKFQLLTTQTSGGQFGVLNSGTKTGLLLCFNQLGGGAQSTSIFRVFLRDEAGKTIDAAITSAFNFTDGNPHTFEITITPTTNTVVIKIDGTSLPVTYTSQQTPSTFANFVAVFTIGARNSNGTKSLFLQSILDNFLIGTANNALYGSYNFNDGANPTADQSGNSNTGSLTGTPLPTYVLGFDNILYADAKTFVETISLTEVFNRVTSRIISDTVTLTESLVEARGLFRTLNDSITLLETFVAIRAKLLADIVYIFEQITLQEKFGPKQTFKILGDTITLNESFSHGGSFAKILIDVITPVEVFTKNVTRVISEVSMVSYILLENGAYLLLETGGRFQLEDNTALQQEFFSKVQGRAFTDSIVLTEVIIKFSSKLLTDSVSVIENIIINLRKGRLFTRLSQLWVASK